MAARAGASAGARAWLAAQRHAAGVLLFRDLGPHPTVRRTCWQVGSPDAPREFIAKNETIRLLHLVVKHGALPVTEFTSAASGGKAAWGKIVTGLDELRLQCPRLADLLQARCTVRGGESVVYCPGASSPRIDTGE